MAWTIVPYRESWPGEFAALSRRLRDALGARALRIDHIGSTSVPGLAAKDIIDVQVSVLAFDDGVREAMTSLGFREKAGITGDHIPPGAPSSADEWRKLLFVQPSGERRANIHIRQAGRLNERYALLFRDYLRAHPEVAEAYAKLKYRLAASLAKPEDYPDVKDPAVDLIHFAAEQWASRGGSPAP